MKNKVRLLLVIICEIHMISHNNLTPYTGGKTYEIFKL